MPIENTNFFIRQDLDNANLSQNASSQGNQRKFQDNGIFYKEDYRGYEGLSEVLASQLAAHTTLIQYGVTKYFPCSLAINNQSSVYCYSYSFNPNKYRELTLYKILISYFNTDLKGIYEIYEETYDTLTLSFFDFVRELLLSLYDYDILPWMTQLLKFDWLILNEDRHFRNISFFLAGGELTPAPLFDNGDSLLSDLICYPLSMPVDECLSKVTAKPFKSSFDVQVKEIEEYGAPRLKFLSNHVELCTSDLSKFYSQEVILRAKSVLLRQMGLLYPDVEVSFV